VKAFASAEAAAQHVPAMHPVATDPAKMDPFDELPLPCVEIDAHGIITSANRASLALHSHEAGQLIGKMAWDLVAPNEKDPSFAAYCSTLISGEQPEVVRRALYDRSGQFRTYEMHRSLVRDAEGNPTGMRMVCVDVSTTQIALEEANRKNQWLDSVLNSICEAILVTDAVGFIVFANPAAESLLGWKESELTGMSIEEGLPLLTYHSGDCTDLKFTMALEGKTKGIATTLDRERREIPIGIGTSPIFDKESGSTTGVVLILRKLEIPA
jgi:PAS domain S-box-containing protein